MKQLNKAVFLDRDGVLNEVKIKNGLSCPPTTLQDLKIAADVLPSLQRLKNAGYLLIMVTNQPDVVRKKISRETVDAINSALRNKLPLDEVMVCFHDDQDQCECRKPAPGLILKAAKNFNIDLNASFMIGDRWRDVEAGQRAHCRTIWLDYNYAEKHPQNPPDYRTTSLNEATNWILK